MIIHKPSTHHSSRANRAVEWIVVHSTNSPLTATPDSTLRFFVSNDRSVSIHEYVAPSAVYRMIPDDRAAHHVESPTAKFPDGVPTVWNNERTWGIEAYQTTGRDTDDAVVSETIRRVVEACRRLGLGADKVIGHREVDPGRRSDPVGVDMHDFRLRVAAGLRGGAPGPPKWEKVVWAIEHGTRILEREGLAVEAGEVKRLYLSDALKRRDGRES